MIRLTNEHLRAAMDYALAEPEFNLFLIGDMEIYGLDGDIVSAYTFDSWDGGTLPCLILSYLNNFLVYSHQKDYDMGKVADFLNSQPMKNLSGKRSLIEPLIPYLKNLEIVPEYLARLDQVNPEALKAAEVLPVQRLTEADVPAIYKLLSQIEEFYTIRQKDKDSAYREILESVTHGGRMYGIYENKNENGSGSRKLTAVAGTAAENSMAAMVVSVSTLPAYRGRGYASGLVTRLCQDCLDEGMQFLCLFYNNPAAGRIYRRLGFAEKGQYAMVRTKDAAR